MASSSDNNNDNDWKVQRDASKHLGDDDFRAGAFRGAILHYSNAISLDPDFAVAFSNRSAAYLKVGEKSRALYDAQECVRLGLFPKGTSRLAAAQQALGRYSQALESWRKVLEDDDKNAAALKGVEDCQAALEKMKEEEPKEEEKQPAKEAESDDLDDFFNEVEEVTTEVQREKKKAAEDVATGAILNHKKDLGTAHEQIERLLQENYKWRNLNPFYVLDLPHTATKEDISKRYKALSLLLHPDKNTTEARAQDAYDEVLKAKQMLDDDNKANHCRQLIEQGMLQGKRDFELRGASNDSLEDFQSRAVHKIFAQIEYERREVEKRQRNYEQREQQKEEEELQKERDEHKFNKQWKKEERVEKRIGNWRDFQKKKKPKS